jgi:hypothetical protein
LAAYIIGAWSLVCLFNTEQTYVTLAVAGRPLTFLHVLSLHAPGMIMWALLTPPIMWLAERYPLDERGIPVHVVMVLLCAFLDAALYRVIQPWIPLPNPTSLFGGFVRYLGINVVNYFAIVAVTLVARYSRLLRERQLAAAELSSQLTTAHLRSLQAQLRPHFLFNTLNTIAELVHRDPEEADRIIIRLGALLRRSFDAFADQEVSLGTELDFLRDYGDIVCARFQGRIRIVIDADENTLNARVPSLILQPLVENAVRHGLEPMVDGGLVEVFASRRGKLLDLEVRDDGLGIQHSTDEHESVRPDGLGLRSTADRLRHMYGNAHSFSVGGRIHGGTIVAIQIPFRLAESTHTASMPRVDTDELLESTR